MNKLGNLYKFTYSDKLITFRRHAKHLENTHNYRVGKYETNVLHHKIIYTNYNQVSFYFTGLGKIWIKYG